MKLEEFCKDPQNIHYIPKHIPYTPTDPELAHYCNKCYALTKDFRCLALGHQHTIVSIQEPRDCDAYNHISQMYFQHYQKTTPTSQPTKKNKLTKILLALISALLILGGITQL